MKYLDIIDRLRDRFVFWPVQGEWAKALGGPKVTREQVAAACRIPEAELERYESIQTAGNDHTLTGVYRR